MSLDVVVCGSLHMDIIVRAPDRPRRGETLAGQSWRRAPGGKGRNQAVEAALAGARTAMIGMVGADEFGTALLSDLSRHQLDSRHVGTAAHGTGMSVAIVDEQGDYGAVIVSGANLQLTPLQLEAAAPAIAAAKWLLLQNEIPDDANLAAAELARRAGTRTILNAAPARPLPDRLAANIDILVVNAIEAETLGGMAVTSLESAAQAAGRLLQQVHTVIVTAGGNGVAMADRDGGHCRIPALPVSVVSTHGAGDCFVGVLAASLAAGFDLEPAVRSANVAAARRVSTKVAG